MADSTYVELLAPRSFAVAMTAPADDVVDLGAYRVLEVSVRVYKAGTGGTIVLQHSATRAEDGFLDVGTAVNLNAATVDFQEITAFLRFVRWRVIGPGGNPVAGIDLIAKS